MGHDHLQLLEAVRRADLLVALRADVLLGGGHLLGQLHLLLALLDRLVEQRLLLALRLQHEERGGMSTQRDRAEAPEGSAGVEAPASRAPP